MKFFLISLKNYIKNLGIIDFLKTNKLLIFLSVLLLIGILFGTLFLDIVSLDTIKKLDFLFLNDFKERNSQSNFSIFISSFSNYSVFIFLIIAMSLSFFGIILIPALIFFKGASIGITIGYLYLIYGLKGIGYHALILLPGLFLSCMSYILISIYAINFSVIFSSVLFPKNNNLNLYEKLKKYLKKSGLISLILVISSLVDVITIILFYKFFIF
ncbi:MAG: stage II sporulation protein M [Candidatus Paraimprobicoccus trichonymphae]|uniref:Stage II sporulation protein M n=1 Tax=Candidatus Paraimprobicoccus trichonymphae TaxID=3033793 RepID=A0AA48KXX1_9FIRM|nr:MAG: stage II sporulation protein M [Candidatus Paraimprobicoccus trichonymphae]